MPCQARDAKLPSPYPFQVEKYSSTASFQWRGTIPVALVNLPVSSEVCGGRAAIKAFMSESFSGATVVVRTGIPLFLAHAKAYSP